MKTVNKRQITEVPKEKFYLPGVFKMFRVPSSSREDKVHYVRLHRKWLGTRTRYSCTCEGHVFHGARCKHIKAIQERR